MSSSLSLAKLTSVFSESNGSRKPDRRKRTPPVSIRFSDDERALLEPHAGNKALSTYVREYVVRTHQGKRKSPSRGVSDPVIAAQLLSALGRSEIPALLRQTLEAVDSGQLMLTGDTERQLRQANENIDLMRLLLVQSLGLRPDKSS